MSAFVHVSAHRPVAAFAKNGVRNSVSALDCSDNHGLFGARTQARRSSQIRCLHSAYVSSTASTTAASAQRMAFLFSKPPPPPPPPPPSAVESVLSFLANLPVVSSVIGLLSRGQAPPPEPEPVATATGLDWRVALAVVLAALIVVCIIAIIRFLHATRDENGKLDVAKAWSSAKEAASETFSPSTANAVVSSAATTAAAAVTDLKAVSVAASVAVVQVGKQVLDEIRARADAPSASTSAAVAEESSVAQSGSSLSQKKLVAPASAPPPPVVVELEAVGVVNGVNGKDSLKNGVESMEDVKALDDLVKLVGWFASKAIGGSVTVSHAETEEEEESQSSPSSSDKKAVNGVDPNWKNEMVGGFPGGEKFYKEWVAGGAKGDVPSLEPEKQPSSSTSSSVEAKAKAPSRGQQSEVDPAWKTELVGGFPGGETFYKRWALQGTLGDVPDLEEELQPRGRP